MLSLSVVGHTNTGKTSLMRTLLRDTTFGEVQNAAATTRHVEYATLGDWIQLYDTPGLEDAGGVLDWLEENTSNKMDGIDRVQQFLASEAAQTEFSQESKVLRQLINSHAALYVIDAREPILPKYKDELTILSWCAKPIMPVFNFTQHADTHNWQDVLSRRHLHVFAAFDTVAFDFEGEIQLWQKLSTMLPEHQSIILLNLIAHRTHEWQNLEQTAKQLIAEFLIDVAAYALSYHNEEQQKNAQNHLQNTVRQHEQYLHSQLVQLYRFYQNEVSGSLNEVLRTTQRNPFDPDLLKVYGIRTGTGAATGALIGLGLDALTLGTSLGLGATLGGLIGGVASNWRTLSDKINGVNWLQLDNATLTLLATRNVSLLHTLQTRGHAAQNEIVAQHEILLWQNNALPEPLKKAQNTPQWSALNSDFVFRQPENQQAVQALISFLN